jgi:tRNA threonylcarbamoyl adenosine modification protein (Sua5/YciO/YrdC/YwlC family)
MVSDPGMLKLLAEDIPAPAELLVNAFWPGPLTLVLRSRPDLRMELGERGETIAVRVPDHDFARSLLRRTGPLAVSSANISGQDAATNCAGAQHQLGGSVAVYIDGGETPGNTPSTIVQFADPREGQPLILREGALGAAEIEAALDA